MPPRCPDISGLAVCSWHLCALTVVIYFNFLPWIELEVKSKSSRAERIEEG